MQQIEPGPVTAPSPSREEIADVMSRAAKNAYFAHDPESYRLNRQVEELAREVLAARDARNASSLQATISLAQPELNLLEYALSQYIQCEPDWCDDLEEGDLATLRDVLGKVRAVREPAP